MTTQWLVVVQVVWWAIPGTVLVHYTVACCCTGCLVGYTRDCSGTLHSGLLLYRLFGGLYKGLFWYTTQSKLVKTQDLHN